MNANENLLTENISAYNIEKSRKSWDWVSEVTAPNVNDYSHDVGGSIRYLLVDDQCNIEKDKITRFYRSISQPTNMQGVEDCSKFMLELNPKYNKLIIHHISITRNNCKLDKLDSSDMQILRREYQAERNILSGDITLSIVLDDVKENDIIEFSYSLINYNEMNIVFFNRFIPLDYSVPVSRWYLSIIASFDMQYKFFGKEYNIQKNHHNDKVVYTLIRENLLPQKIEKYIPYWHYPISLLQIGCHTNWKDISTYIEEFFNIVDINHEEANQFHDELKDKDLSQEEIILNLLNFIHKNIRYFSNFKATDFIKPANPNLVLARGYGDCKDFVSLFRNFLAIFKIKSDPVLVHTQYGRALDEHLPSASMFDHVIIQVQLDGENYFIDPTIRQEVTSLKNLYLPDYGWGLLCDGVTAGLLKINNKVFCVNYISVSEEYRCSSWENNEFIFKSRTLLKGQQALRFKQTIDSQSENKVWEKMIDYYNQFMKINEVIEHKVENFKNIDNEMIYALCYRVSLKTMIKKNGEYSIEVFPDDILEHIYHKLPQQIDSDFYYGPPIAVDYHISIVDEKTNFSGKKGVMVSNAAFVLNKISEGKKGKFEFTYQFKKINDVIPKEKYAEFISKHNDALNILPACIVKSSSVNMSWLYMIKTIYRIFLAIVLISMIMYSFITINF